MGCHATRKLVTKSLFVSGPDFPAIGTTWGRTWGCPMWTEISAGSSEERNGLSSRGAMGPPSLDHSRGGTSPPGVYAVLVAGRGGAARLLILKASVSIMMPKRIA